MPVNPKQNPQTSQARRIEELQALRIKVLQGKLDEMKPILQESIDIAIADAPSLKELDALTANLESYTGVFEKKSGVVEAKMKAEDDMLSSLFGLAYLIFGAPLWVKVSVAAVTMVGGMVYYNRELLFGSEHSANNEIINNINLTVVERDHGNNDSKVTIEPSQHTNHGEHLAGVTVTNFDPAMAAG